MPTFTTKGSTTLYYKVWGPAEGPVITFSHGWPLSSDNWDAQMFFFSTQGYRCIAHDRRGHGRSDQPWTGNDMDTYADDLFELFEHLDLKNVTMIGHSTGGGEVARFVGRHGTNRVKRAVLIGAVTPLMLKTSTNSLGLPIDVFDSFRTQTLNNRAQFFLEVPSGPFFGFNRDGVTPNQGLIWSWWQQGMMAGLKGCYDCIKAFSETDFTDDLRKMDIPVLVLHGDDDQIVGIEASALQTIKLLPKGTLKVYRGGSHALPNTDANRINQDILEFVNA